MKITWLGNAGVYLQDGKQTILIDGIYEGNSFFNSQPSIICQQAAVGKGIHFRHINVLAFTHRHADHFSSQYVNAYLRHNRVERIYLPHAGLLPMPYADFGYIDVKHVTTRQCWIGEKNESFLYDIFSNDSGIAFFKTQHMGANMLNVDHYSIMIMSQGCAYIFMGDTDWSYPAERLQRILYDVPVKLICINPLAYADRRRQAWLQKLGSPSIALYHIPRAGDDVSGMRRMALSGLALNEIKKEYILQTVGQVIHI